MCYKISLYKYKNTQNIIFKEETYWKYLSEIIGGEAEEMVVGAGWEYEHVLYTIYPLQYNVIASVTTVKCTAISTFDLCII